MLTAVTVRALVATALQALDHGDLPTARLVLEHLAAGAAEDQPAGPVTGPGPVPIAAPVGPPPGSVHSMEAVVVAGPITVPAHRLESLPKKTRINETATIRRTP